MSFLVKRLFKINVSLKTSVLLFFFFPMRVGPVRVTIYNERAVAQVDIRKIQRIILSGARNQTNSPPPAPQKKKTLQAPHSHITDKKLL